MAGPLRARGRPPRAGCRRGSAASLGASHPSLRARSRTEHATWRARRYPPRITTATVLPETAAGLLARARASRTRVRHGQCAWSLRRCRTGSAIQPSSRTEPRSGQRSATALCSLSLLPWPVAVRRSRRIGVRRRGRKALLREVGQRSSASARATLGTCWQSQYPLDNVDTYSSPAVRFSSSSGPSAARRAAGRASAGRAAYRCRQRRSSPSSAARHPRGL